MSAAPQQNVQIRRNGSPIGTFELQSMRSLISSGMILPTDHYLYDGMNDWQAVGETWAERPQLPATEPAAAVADSSALKEYIVWYEDRPTGPRKIASQSPLNAAKDFALQSAHGAQEFVVCVRIDQAKDVHKFKRSAGVWSNMEALIMSPLSPNFPRVPGMANSDNENQRMKKSSSKDSALRFCKVMYWVILSTWIICALVTCSSRNTTQESPLQVLTIVWAFIGWWFLPPVAILNLILKSAQKRQKDHARLDDLESRLRKYEAEDKNSDKQ